MGARGEKRGEKEINKNFLNNIIGGMQNGNCDIRNTLR